LITKPFYWEKTSHGLSTVHGGTATSEIEETEKVAVA
jgi:hypothetical protein